jgi:RNA ligase (TIGR02306 family)
MALRKLASIQMIKSLEPIEGADKIEKASVLGWDVVVKKNEFSVGDHCIFCEIDSVLPDGSEWSEFMRDRRFRVKTIKLRGVLSQGIAFPLSVLPDSENLPLDTEVTEQLGIVKYEPSIHHGGKHLGCSAGSFPHDVPKTDELRLQSKLYLLRELSAAGSWYASIKVDGTSSTFCYDTVDGVNQFVCCSRNWKKKDDSDNIYWKMARKYNLEEVLANKQQYAIQGEIAGPSIQGNKLQLKETDLFVFDVYDREEKRYLGFQELCDFCEGNKLTHVPILCVSENPPKDIEYSKEGFLKLAEGKYSKTENPQEGIVVRPLKTTYSKTLQSRLSFKVINNQFLLKEK